MKKSKSNAAAHTLEKKSQQDQILDRLFDYFSKPKGEKPSSDSEIEVNFYRSTLTEFPRNFHNDEYAGINVIMLLQEQDAAASKIPIYSTFKQAATLLEQHKEQLPPKSATFDPTKPLKGIKLNAQVVKYLATYKKDGQAISQTLFERETKGMSFNEMREKGYKKRSGLKLYKVFPIEKIKHLLPQSYIDERPYFAKQDQLEKQVMSDELKDEQFVKKALTIIEAMGVPVIEKNEGRAYYSPRKHEIVIPPRNKFKCDKSFLAVVLHELSHSTSKALNRDMSSAFGTAGYAKEEIIAETATMFNCLNEGLETFSSHCRYIEGWASNFADKKKVLLSICKQAKEAQQYITDKVAGHKLKLANQASYTIPRQLEQDANFSPKYCQELREFINIQADSYGTMIPLRNKKIVGLNRISKGVEVFTEHKSVKIYGPVAKALENKLSDLEMKQELFNETELTIAPLEQQTVKQTSSNRLSMK